MTKHLCVNLRTKRVLSSNLQNQDTLSAEINANLNDFEARRAMERFGLLEKQEEKIKVHF